MADVGSLGQYKVVVTADYSQLKAQFEQINQIVSTTAKTITDTLTATSNAVNNSMANSFKAMAQSITTSMKEAQNAMNGFGTEAKTVGQGLEQISKGAGKAGEGAARSGTSAKAGSEGFKAYAAQVREAEKAEQRFRAQQGKAILAAEERAIAGRTAQHRAFWEEQVRQERRVAQQRDAEARRQTQRVNNLQTQYRVAYGEIDKYLQSHTKMSEAVFVRLQGKISAIGNELRRLGSIPPMPNPLEGMDFDRYASGFSRLGDAIQSFRHHLTWMASAVAIGTLVGLPVAISEATKEFEALNTKIMQNLELADQYRGNHAALTADVQKLGQVAQNYAKGFGMSVNEVQEAMQIISRRFKDVNTATYLTGVALKMSKLDFVDTAKSARDLESVLLQFGMGAKDAGKFLNDFSVLLHTARINGTEMLDALERSGSAFRALNMNVSEAMAAIATLSTATGLTGSTIGMTFKSIATNLDTKKGRQALEALNIKLYEFDDTGRKVVRNGAQLFLELQEAFKGLNEEGQRNLAYLIAGGKYQANAAMALLRDTGGNFKKFLDDMKKLSSDSMTDSLLEKSLDTYATGIERFKASVTVLAQSIGGTLLPAMEGIVYIGLGVVETLNNNASTIGGTIKALGQLALAFVMVKGAMMAWAFASSVLAGISAVYAGIRAAIMGVALAEGASTLATTAYGIASGIVTGIEVARGIATGVLTGQLTLAGLATVALGSATAFLTGTLLPLIATITAVIAVIALLGIALYEVVTNWDKYSNDIQYIWNTLVDFIADAVEFIIDLFTPLIAVLYFLFQVVKTVFQELIIPVVKDAAEAFNGILNWVKEKLNIHGGLVQGIMNGIAGIFRDAVKWINDNVSPAFAQFLDNTIGVLVRFAQRVAQIAADVKATIKDMLTIGDSKSGGSSGLAGVNADYNPEDDYLYGTAVGNTSKGFFSDIIERGKKKFQGLIDSEMGKSFAGMTTDAGNPYANTPELMRGFDDLDAGGAGKGGKGSKGKGSKGAKKADNSPEAMGYRYLTSKGLDKNMVLGILANIAHESSFNPDATNGNHWGMIQWDSDRWGRFLDEYLSMRGMSQSDYYSSDVNTKRTLQYDYIVHEMTKGAERGSYQKILDAVPSTPEQWAHLINMHYERSGVYSGGTDWERQKSAREYATRFERKNGEDNYTDGEKAIENAYKEAKKLFDLELQKLKYEREMKGEKVTALDEKALYEKIMFVNGKNPYALLEQAQKDYQKQLLEAAKYEAKRQEDIKKSTDTQVKAIEKMADSEIAFAEKIGLINKADVRNYEYEKNERNYATKMPALSAKLGATVDMLKGTADDMANLYKSLIHAQDAYEAEHYAKKVFSLSRDVDATQKALDEMLKLEQSYQDKRAKLEQDAFEYKNRYTLKFIDSLSSAIGSSLEGILNRTKTFAEAFRDIFKAVVNDIIKLFSEDFAQRIKKWLTNAIFKPKSTGNPAGSYVDTDMYYGKGNGFNLLGWAGGKNGVSLLGGGYGKSNPLLKAMGLTPNLAAQAKAMITPVTYTLRNSVKTTFDGLSNLTAQGMNTISAGVQTGTEAMSMTFGNYKVMQVQTNEIGDNAIIAKNQSTAATVQATSTAMMGWLMAILALFSLFGGHKGDKTSHSTSSTNLGRAPETYYMTPTPVLQSTNYTVPSMDIGGNIERDMLIFAHKNEMVLTPEQADVIRSTARAGGSMGNSGNASASVKSNINVSTVDSRGFDRVLRDYSRDLSKNIKKSIRNGYLNAKGLV